MLAWPLRRDGRRPWRSLKLPGLGMLQLLLHAPPLLLLLLLGTAAQAFVPPAAGSTASHVIARRPSHAIQQPKPQTQPVQRQPMPSVLVVSAAPSVTAGSDPSGLLLTREEIEACAADFGIELRLSTLGPFYRVIARLKGEAEAAEPMGYTEGFVAPLFGLVHLDTMQVRRRYWKQLKRDGKRQFRFGCGVLLGALAMRHAYDCGCRKAELLAINDDERTHALLKAFYRTAGFVEVKEVTQNLACVPDLLVWGGVGTRMDMRVEEFLRKWRPMILSRGVEFKGGVG